jgi:Flp pilus assembly pilin Flp
MLRRIADDQSGGASLEYALVADLIIVGAIAVATSVGGKVLARWNDLNDAFVEGAKAQGQAPAEAAISPKQAVESKTSPPTFQNAQAVEVATTESVKGTSPTSKEVTKETTESVTTKPSGTLAAVKQIATPVEKLSEDTKP